MRDAPPTLINFDHIEALPAALMAGRGNAAVRALAGAEWLLRRKSDGRWLAVVAGQRVRALRPGALRAARGRMDETHLVERLARPPRRAAPHSLPLAPLRTLLADLGIEADYGRSRGLVLVPEPATLAFAGFDRYRRPLWLTADAARG